MGWLRDRRIVAAVVSAYVVGLVVLVTGPWGWALNRLTVATYVQFRHDWPLAPAWAGPEHYGMVLNVVLFVPLGVLLVLVTGRPWWWVTAAAALASALIEVAQWQWLARQGTWHDVVANTLGAMCGGLGVTLAGRVRSRRAGRPGSPRPR